MGKTITAPNNGTATAQAAPPAPSADLKHVPPAPGRPARPTPPPPPMARANGPAVQPAPERKTVTFGKIATDTGDSIILYGPPGVGKTTLALMAPGPIAILDLDRSLPKLIRDFRDGFDIRPISNVETFADLLAILRGDGWDDIKTIVIDSATKAEELAGAHVCATIPHEKGNRITCLEDYGYGSGYKHLFEAFLLLLAALERHLAAGRNVILVCHDTKATVPNPAGEDFLRYEPRLYHSSTKKETTSIRDRTTQWSDHTFCIINDICVKDGKGIGATDRNIYAVTTPHCLAKNRAGIDLPLHYPKWDATLWDLVFGAPAEPAPAAQA